MSGVWRQSLREGFEAIITTAPEAKNRIADRVIEAKRHRGPGFTSYTGYLLMADLGGYE
jgi:hypothetical protein